MRTLKTLLVSFLLYPGVLTYGQEAVTPNWEELRDYNKPTSTHHLESMIQSGAWHWPDKEGNHINAHGAGFLYHQGTYYWYGEYRPEGAYHSGVSCYSSKDLLTWKYEGVLWKPVKGDRSHDLAYGGIFERPKVLYNEKTGKFVMHFKLKLMEEEQSHARHGSPMYYGVAVSNKPAGPFIYSHKYILGEEGAGDIALYKDDDGKAYVFCAKKPKHHMGFIRLTDDYMNVTGEFTALSEKATAFEAPAVFKHKGRYIVFGSHTKGYTPTYSKYAYAESLSGPWSVLNNFARGPGNNLGQELTFGGQVTFVLPVQGKDNAYIAVFDQWRKPLTKSSYIWLPVRFDEQDIPYVTWLEEWQLDIFNEGLEE